MALRTLKFAAQFALWAVVLLAPMELYFRVTGLGGSPRLQVHSAGLVTVPQPGTRVVHRREGFSAFHYNANGLRGPALSPTPEPGERRVAFLGDSYTEALQVQTDEIFTSRLAARLDLRALNFGMSGDNLVSELLRFRTVVAPRAPQLVVLVSTDGDLLDAMVYSERKSARWVGDDVVVDASRFEWNASARLFRWRQALRDRFASYAVLQRFQQLAKTARASLRTAFGGPSAGPVDAELREDTQVPPENIERYAALLGRLRADVEARGAQLVGVHLPKGYTVRDDVRTLRAAYADAYARAGVPFVSAFDALQVAYRARRFTHFNQPERGGSHLTALGHAVVADVLAEALETGPWQATAAQAFASE